MPTVLPPSSMLSDVPPPSVAPPAKFTSAGLFPGDKLARKTAVPVPVKLPDPLTGPKKYALRPLCILTTPLLITLPTTSMFPSPTLINRPLEFVSPPVRNVP